MANRRKPSNDHHVLFYESHAAGFTALPGLDLWHEIPVAGIRRVRETVP